MCLSATLLLCSFDWQKSRLGEECHLPWLRCHCRAIAAGRTGAAGAVVSSKAAASGFCQLIPSAGTARLLAVKQHAVGANRSARQLSRLLEELVRWLAWLRCPGVLRLSHSDGPRLRPALEQVQQQAKCVHEETGKLVQELTES